MSTQSISPASASAQFTYPIAAAAVAVAPSYFPVPFHLQNPQYAAWPAVTPAASAVPLVPAYNAAYPMPQVQQAQQLFQKDSKMITPEALATVKAAIANSEKDKKVETTKKAVPRKAAGQSWEDPTCYEIMRKTRSRHELTWKNPRKTITIEESLQVGMIHDLSVLLCLILSYPTVYIVLHIYRRLTYINVLLPQYKTL